MNNKYLDGGSTMSKAVIAIGKPAERNWEYIKVQNER